MAHSLAWIWVFAARGAENAFFFFFQAEDGIRDYKVTGVQTCALPIYLRLDHAVRGIEPEVARGFELRQRAAREVVRAERVLEAAMRGAGIDEERVPQLTDVTQPLDGRGVDQDRKSTRLNSSHLVISYAVFCLK